MKEKQNEVRKGKDMTMAEFNRNVQLAKADGWKIVQEYDSIWAKGAERTHELPNYIDRENSAK